MRKFGILALIVLMAFTLSFLPACGGGQTGGATPGAIQTSDSAKTIAWKTLMTDKQIYDTTFQTLALMEKQGKLTAAKTKAIDLGNKYVIAHNAAVTMLLADQVVSLANVKVAFEAFLAEAALLGVK